MKQTERFYILQFLHQNYPKAVYEGVIEDYIRATHNYKASNVARVCRTLRSEGYIIKIPKPHPENGRQVNTYSLSEPGRKYFLNTLTPEIQDFLTKDWGGNHSIVSPQAALF